MLHNEAVDQDAYLVRLSVHSYVVFTVSKENCEGRYLKREKKVEQT